MSRNIATSLYETDMFSGHVRRMLALLRHETLIVHRGLNQHVLKNAMKYATVDCSLEPSEGDCMYYILNVTEGISYRCLCLYRDFKDSDHVNVLISSSTCTVWCLEDR